MATCRQFVRSILACALTLTTAAAATAASDARAFDRVRSSAPDFAAIRLLERKGLPTGFPGDAFDGRKPRTRFEFCTAVERLFRAARDRWTATPPGPADDAALAALEQLLKEYRLGVTDLGGDPQEMLDTLAQLRLSIPRSTLRTSSRSGLSRSPLAGSAALQRSLLSRPDGTGSIRSDSVASSGAFGAGYVGLRVDPADRLLTSDRLALVDPTDLLGYRAQFSMPLGRYLLSAFVEREAALSDRYGFLYPNRALGPTAGYGGGVAGPLVGRLGFRVETGRFEPVIEDPTHTLFLRGSLQYRLAAGLSLDLGFERSRAFGLPGDVTDNTAYSIGIGREFGRNSRFDLLYRTFGARNQGADSDSPSFRDSGALGRITVRF